MGTAWSITAVIGKHNIILVWTGDPVVSLGASMVRLWSFTLILCGRVAASARKGLVILNEATRTVGRWGRCGRYGVSTVPYFTHTHWTI